MPLAVRDYTWEETENMLFLTVPLKGVKANKVDILSTEDYLKVCALLTRHCLRDDLVSFLRDLYTKLSI